MQLRSKTAAGDLNRDGGAWQSQPPTSPVLQEVKLALELSASQ